MTPEKKKYLLHPEYGAVCFRTFTCLSGNPDGVLTDAEALKFQKIETQAPTIKRSAGAKMVRSDVIIAVLHRDSSVTEESLGELKTPSCVIYSSNILLKNIISKKT